jgi:peptidoglycan hydrolase CwlO-like protein
MRITNTESNVDTLQSKMATAQSDITSLTTRITAEQSNVDTLQHKTYLKK